MHTHFSFPKYRSAHSVARRAGSIELPTMIAMSATRRRCIHHHPTVSRTGATRRLLEMTVAQMGADVPGNKPGQVDIKKGSQWLPLFMHHPVNQDWALSLSVFAQVSRKVTVRLNTMPFV
jgi:hypothetical protein